MTDINLAQVPNYNKYKNKYKKKKYNLGCPNTEYI